MFRRKVKYTAVDKMLSKLLQKQGLSKKEAFRLIEKNVYASGEEEAASSNPQEEADYPRSAWMSLSNCVNCNYGVYCWPGA